MNENSAPVRWLRRYKLFFLLGLLILSVQVFLAYKSLLLSDLSTSLPSHSGNLVVPPERLEAGDAGPTSDGSNQFKEQQQHEQRTARPTAQQQSNPNHTLSSSAQKWLGFQPNCEIVAKDAISALHRASTKDCQRHISEVACAIQNERFYAAHLPHFCPAGNHSANTLLGCYRDLRDNRLLTDFFVNLKTSNSPSACIQLCLQSGFPYAGVQYGTECFCGNDLPLDAVKLADSSCNIKCSGDPKVLCGGYFTMGVYETGIAKFVPRVAETKAEDGVQRVKIAFLLTLNGRALRQVHRLITALYSKEHIYYIHVDARQDYLYRKLLELEEDFPNIRLARKRFSTIWGGASLLTMLLQSMSDLLASSRHWDFVINLSESDFPVKTIDRLVDFLSANRNANFVKSHGRKTQRFIQKQGLDKTFVECDHHMWRIGDRKLPTGIQIDGGSDWVALSRSFVDYVTANIDKDPLLQGLRVIFRHTLLPAESFFHTVLRNSKFCHTYTDNNLHVTNWKRKLGCKCQYKHVVDWCGCSPNDFRPDDWSRLQNTQNKQLFFARKFEPIINQAVILQLEEWLFGPHADDYANLHAYWQSFYNTEDKASASDDLYLTLGDSLARSIGSRLNLESPYKIQELSHYVVQDDYKGFLLRFKAMQRIDEKRNETLELEARIRTATHMRVAKNSKFARRLRNFEVSSEFDVKEEVSRNFARILGPYTEVVLSFTLAGNGQAHQSDSSHTYNLTVLWIDPQGQLQDYTELHIEDVSVTDAVNFSKAVIRSPLTPGLWTVKLIGREGIYAETKFLIIPLAKHSGKAITDERSKVSNGGAGSNLSNDFSLPAEWLQYLPTVEESALLKRLAEEKAGWSGASLLNWIDDLVGKNFLIREICTVTGAGENFKTSALSGLPMCDDTIWSTLSPDPKSDMNALRKR